MDAVTLDPEDVERLRAERERAEAEARTAAPPPETPPSSPGASAPVQAVTVEPTPEDTRAGVAFICDGLAELGAPNKVPSEVQDRAARFMHPAAVKYGGRLPPWAPDVLAIAGCYMLYRAAFAPPTAPARAAEETTKT